MGCDIHTTLTTSYARDGVEREFMELGHDVLRDRGYFFFALLAGVRNQERWNLGPISEPRGFPKWFNNGHHNLGDGEGALAGDHTPSWLTIEELRIVARRYEAEKPDGWSDGKKSRAIDAICDYAEASIGLGEKIYFIFSFDS